MIIQSRIASGVTFDDDVAALITVAVDLGSGQL